MYSQIQSINFPKLFIRGCSLAILSNYSFNWLGIFDELCPKYEMIFVEYTFSKFLELKKY